MKNNCEQSSPLHAYCTSTVLFAIIISRYFYCFPTKWYRMTNIQYIPRNMHTVFALLCFVVVIHWLIFPYPSGILHWHCGNLTIAPVPAKQPWWIWINPSCEFIMNECITTTKQSTTKPCAYLLGYTVDAAYCRHSTTRELCTWFAFCCVLVLSSLNRSHPHIFLNCFLSTVIVRKPVKLPWWIWVNEWHDCAKIWRCKHDDIINIITGMSTTLFSLEFHQCTWNIYLEDICIHICYSYSTCICIKYPEAVWQSCLIIHT